MSEIITAKDLKYQDFLPHQKVDQGLFPTNEDWQRLLASALPEEDENE
jgi:hypothetical protein